MATPVVDIGPFSQREVTDEQHSRYANECEFLQEEEISKETREKQSCKHRSQEQY